jgi:ankyrin repeat protein
VLQLLREHNTNIDARDYSDRTALHWAVGRGQEAVMRLLLEHKADVDATDGKGKNCDATAAVSGNEAVMRLLLSILHNTTNHRVEQFSTDTRGTEKLVFFSED